MGAGLVFFGGDADGDESLRCRPRLFAISGLIPLTQTLFLWQSLATAAILIAVSVAISFFRAPSAENARTAEDFGIDLEDRRASWSVRTRARRMAGVQPVLTILVVLRAGFLSGATPSARRRKARWPRSISTPTT